MFKTNKIRLFWWSEPLIMGKPKENYGDLVGKYLVEKISKKIIEFAHPKKFNVKDLWQPIYVTVGSILAHVNKKCIVWGSGIIEESQIVKPATFLAVRGPETHRILVKQGFNVPEVYGDPALLLPMYFNPEISKEYSFGIIPHYVDYPFVKEWFKNNDAIVVIDLMTNDVEETTKIILQCERIVSSSLHGVIVSHAYNIPAVWVKFSNRLFGDNIKFKDYFRSVEIKPYDAVSIEFEPEIPYLEHFFTNINVLPKEHKLDVLRNGLMASCPFLNV